MEVKNSQLLDFLIQKGKQIGNGTSGSLTCERLLAASIEYLFLQSSNSWEKEHRLEAVACRGLLRKQTGINWPEVFSRLIPHIGQMNASDLMVNSILTQKRLLELRQKAQQTQKEQLSLVMVLEHLLDNPTTTIQECLSGEKEEKDVFLDELLDVEMDLPEPEETPKKRAGAVAELAAKAKSLQDALLAEVFGQDYAISVVSAGYFQAELLAMTDKSKVRPKATFLFAGPPGVGKTFMAENIAKHLGLPFMRFDMSEYADKEASIEFCGSDKVYKNGKAGNVTSFVEKNPKCVLLFDEVEKSHLSVIHLFLQMLDAGRLRDNYTDTEIPFKDVIVIMTTNAGKQLYTDNESGDFSGVSRKVILKALSTDTNPVTGAPFFPAAICSRFASGNVVMFNQMGAHNLRGIAKKEVGRHVKNFQERIGLPVEVDDRVYTALLLAEGGKADARTVRARSEAFFDNEVYELFRLLSAQTHADKLEEMESIRIDVELPADKEEIVALFEDIYTPQVLVFGDEKLGKLCRQKAGNCAILPAQDHEQALLLLKNRDIKVILIDPTYGLYDASKQYLNMEDVPSKARDFFNFLRQSFSSIPVYMLQTDGVSFTTEEKLSYTRAGVRNIIAISATQEDRFAEGIRAICNELHQQYSMNSLARANKVLSFETAQSLSADGKHATIRLFDFKLTLAVAAEDEGSILADQEKPNVRFADVIGAKDAQTELQYFVQYLRNPKKYLGTGVRAPKGVLLYGPPGTGKTMLAKAMACESGVAFIAAEGNQFVQRYVGQGKDQVHEIFQRARKYAPAILFIDEIDAIGKDRRFAEATNSEEAALTAFLTEMDGFKNDPSRPVFVLAATNYDVTPNGRKSLDPALLRRFDRRVLVDLPDREDRVRYIRLKMKGNPAYAMSDAAIDNVALRSTGMSLAALESVMELALRSAIRSGSEKVTDEIFEESFELFNSGDAKKWDADQLERVARHETGHALLSWLSGDKPSYLTIVARGNHGGYMQHGDTEGKHIYTREDLLARIRTSLGGRAAEMLYYGEQNGLSTGAGADLQNATATAQRILCNYGMDSQFGLAVVSQEASQQGEIAGQVRAAVNEILQQQMELAVQLLQEHKEKFDRMVKILMEKNHLNGEQIDKVFSE